MRLLRWLVSAAQVHGVDAVLEINHRRPTIRTVTEVSLQDTSCCNASIKSELYLQKFFGFGTFSPVTQNPVSLFSKRNDPTIKKSSLYWF